MWVIRSFINKYMLTLNITELSMREHTLDCLFYPFNCVLFTHNLCGSNT